MRKKIVTVLLAVSLTMSLSACGATTSESSTPSPEPAKTESSVEDEATTPEPEVTDETEKEEPEDEDESIETTDTDTEAENDLSKSALDMDQCISDLKDNLSLEPDYSFVQDYYIGVKDDQITITAVVDDATDPNVALDLPILLYDNLIFMLRCKIRLLIPHQKIFTAVYINVTAHSSE